MISRRIVEGDVIALVMSVVLGVTILTGCTRAVDPQGMATAPDDAPYRFESEGQVPPPGPGSARTAVDRVDVFEETPLAEGAVVFETVVEEVPPADTADDSTMTGPGYRVQVFATGSRETAEAYEMEAEIRLGIDAYVERIDGIYKVRAGDCRSRERAEDLLRECRRAGYQDAWIVATEIRWRRPDRVTSTEERSRDFTDKENPVD